MKSLSEPRAGVGWAGPNALANCRPQDTFGDDRDKAIADFQGLVCKLRDDRAKRAITNRISRIGYGLFGDSKLVGEGVSELRIAVGPGYRVYFAHIGGAVVLLLCGGDKSSQPKDIAPAKTLAAQAKDGSK